MKLTVVTAVFNAIKSGNRENLIRCVKSVAALKTEHEHLIYDGGSTDGTVELLRELVKEVQGDSSSSRVDGLNSDCRALEGSESSSSETKSESGISDTHSSTWTLDLNCHSRLRVTSEPDTGIYNALNKGVRDAKGEWFYVLGCDDRIIDADQFEKAINSGIENGSDIVASPVYTSEDLSKILVVHRELLFCGGAYPHQGVLMRQSLSEKIGCFDEHYAIAADYELLLRAVLKGAKVTILDKAYSLYGSNGISSNGGCRTDVQLVLKNILGLSSQEVKSLVDKRVMPWRVLLRLLFSESSEVRFAAKCHFQRCMSDTIHWSQIKRIMRRSFT